MKSTLEEIQQYRNDAIVLRFMETWEMPFEEAEDIFNQTKKWLWLAAYMMDRSEEVPDLAITQSLKLVDEMWHTFILFTRDYQEFCDRYFGFYIHHKPTPQSEYMQQISSYEADKQHYMVRMEERFKAQYELIYDVLGEETLLKWYSAYSDKYTDEYMRSIFRWSYSPYDTRVREQVRLAQPEVAQSAPAQAAARS